MACFAEVAEVGLEVVVEVSEVDVVCAFLPPELASTRLVGPDQP